MFMTKWQFSFVAQCIVLVSELLTSIETDEAFLKIIPEELLAIATLLHDSFHDFKTLKTFEKMTLL